MQFCFEGCVSSVYCRAMWPTLFSKRSWQKVYVSAWCKVLFFVQPMTNFVTWRCGTSSFLTVQWNFKIHIFVYSVSRLWKCNDVTAECETSRCSGFSHSHDGIQSFSLIQKLFFSPKLVKFITFNDFKIIFWTTHLHENNLIISLQQNFIYSANNIVLCNKLSYAIQLMKCFLHIYPFLWY